LKRVVSIIDLLLYA